MLCSSGSCAGACRGGSRLGLEKWRRRRSGCCSSCWPVTLTCGTPASSARLAGPQEDESNYAITTDLGGGTARRRGAPAEAPLRLRDVTAVVEEGWRARWPGTAAGGGITARPHAAVTVVPEDVETMFRV